MMETRHAPRSLVLLVLAGLILGLMGIIAIQDGWFALRPPFDLNGQPALVFFTLSDGCECKMKVVQSAEAQLTAWELPADLDLNVIRVDFVCRSDLARQYGVARAPALVLLDAAGKVVWKQDVGLSDEAPLDLYQAEIQIDKLMQNP